MELDRRDHAEEADATALRSGEASIELINSRRSDRRRTDGSGSVMGYQSSDDAALVDELRRGDQAALETLYERYADRVYGLAARMLDRASAEDVVQEAFVKLWRRPDGFDPNRGGFASWFLRVAHNLAVDRKRRQRRQRQHQVDPSTTERLDGLLEQASHPEANPHQQLECSARHARLHDALSRMNDEQRRVLMLAYFDGLTHQEIADHLEIPLGTVKTRARSGLRKLREWLHALEEAPWPD
ncbi:MAG: RNA polymerase sigma factor [Candidatus Bipolaricaulia bacterium]